MRAQQIALRIQVVKSITFTIMPLIHAFLFVLMALLEMWQPNFAKAAPQVVLCATVQVSLNVQNAQQSQQQTIT